MSSTFATTKLRTPAANMQPSRIPTVSCAGGIPTKPYMMGTATSRSRSRRGSSASECEDRPSMDQARTTTARDRSQPRSSSRPPATRSLSQSRNKTPSGNSAPPAKQPKNESGSSMLRFGKAAPAEDKSRKVLRRKAPSIEQYSKAAKPQPNPSVSVPRPSIESVSDDRMTTPDRQLTGSRGGDGVASHSAQARQQTRNGPAVPPSQQTTSNMAMGSQNHSIPKEFRSLMSAPSSGRNLMAHPTPPVPVAASPSTMYSESPGPWSSRNSTPTSISSYSPGIVHPTKVGSRLRQPSPSISSGSAQQQPTRHLSPSDASGISSAAALLSGSPQRRPRKGSYTLPVNDYQPTESQLKLASLSLTAPTSQAHGVSGAAKPKSSTEIVTNRSESKKQSERSAAVPRDPAADQQRSAQSLKPPASTTAPRPPRPTRRGTDELALDSSPVIHSSLSASRIPGHRTQLSSDLRNAPKPKPSVTRPANTSSESLQSTSSRLAYRSPSPNVANLQSRHAKSVPTGDSKSLDPQRKETPPVNSKRFGMFTRKSKTVPEVTAPRKEKENRKGPAAGTGHEGYGKYAARGRRPSIGSSTSRARSTSTSASTSQSSIVSRAPVGMDDFLRDRLEPIIISGGGMDGAELTRTGSGQSLGNISLASTTRSEPYAAYPASSYSTDSLASFGGRLVQSPETYAQSGAWPLGGMQDEPKRQKKAVLTKRRSFRKSLMLGGKESQTQGGQGGITFRSPWLGSTNTSSASLARLDSGQSDSHEGQIAKGVKAAKSEKPSKWNFFQRSRNLNRKQSQTDLRSAAMPEVTVSVNKLPASKQKPHYALLDNEQIDSDSLEDLLRRIDESPPTEAEDSEPNPVGLGLKRHHGQSVLLPEAPPALLGFAFDKPPSSPKVFLNKDLQCDEREPSPAETQPTRARGIRLTSVGRIPKVVPREGRQPLPTQTVPSFSRPFSRAEMASPITADDSTYLAPSASLDVPQAGTPFWQVPDPNSQSGVNPLSGREFIAFSPRKGSDETGSSFSDNRKSLTAFTAVIPPPGATLTGDEIWDEYDEFLDHVASPNTGPELVDPTRRNPFLWATEASKALQEGLNEEANRDSTATVPSICSGVTSIASTALSAEQPTSVHLRRSMVFDALHASLALSTPRSFSEFQHNVGEEKPYSGKLTAQPSSSSLRTQRPLPVPAEQPTVNLQTSRKRNTLLLDVAERNRYGALAQANLRSGSLMTSRWLSFGRVLFSPAQNHVQSQDQSRILVIDGLGNDDWSFYCALTYSKATVYNLTASQSFAASTNPAAWAPPPNHRTVYRANLESPFPFPRGFFAAVILRFPAACAETDLRATISECKRVLRAGGYLELSVLDLDMVNMGSRTRKAVRILKERMYTADSTISLKPASDNIQRLLGKRGFENLNRCMVVVPVAGSIMASSDTSSSSQSAGLGSASSNPSSAWTEKASHNRPPSDSADVSLGELLADSSPSASNDESIAKMVARVGRWWYTRCYESCVLSDGNLDDSMWSDRRLLRECQRRGTGFKLLIAYAQKPTELPRRTVSV